MNTIDKSKFPALAALMESGKIWIENQEYVGMASDDSIVSLGTVGFEADCEKFVAGCGPEEW